MSDSRDSELEFAVAAKKAKLLLAAGSASGCILWALVFFLYDNPLPPFLCLIANLVCCIAGADKAVQVMKSGALARILALLFSIVPVINSAYSLLLIRALIRAERVLKDGNKPVLQKEPGRAGRAAVKPRAPWSYKKKASAAMWFVSTTLALAWLFLQGGGLSKPFLTLMFLAIAGILAIGWFAAKAKGYSGFLGMFLMVFMQPIGIVILLTLRDRNEAGPTRPS